MTATSPGRNVVLVADDFAISAGVSLGIETLARHKRISATSAIVTLPRWRRDARRLAELRGHVAIGLHINLTLQSPIGIMPTLAPRGLLPSIATLTKLAIARRINATEISAEISRQLEAFVDATGHAPDIIDGHQHAHALPVVRDALIDSLQRAFGSVQRKPLVRVPAHGAQRLVRRSAVMKAGLISVLSKGAAAPLRSAGFPINESFAGVSRFATDERAIAGDFAADGLARHGLAIVMCHPGVPTRELAEIDTLLERRAAELAFLGHDNALTSRLWHPARAADGPQIDWRHERMVMS
ncbi:MAG: ChbG/HpnK family deacetylase [Hyphomicrobiaceae bacterium]